MDADIYPLAKLAVRQAIRKLSGAPRQIARLQYDDCVQIAAVEVWKARQAKAQGKTATRNAATQVMRYCHAESKHSAGELHEDDTTELADKAGDGWQDGEGQQCEDEEVPPPSLSPSPQTLTMLHAAGLTQLEQDIAMLVYAHSYTYSEAAERLGVSERDVRNGVARCRRKGMRVGVGCGC